MSSTEFEKSYGSGFERYAPSDIDACLSAAMADGDEAVKSVRDELSSLKEIHVIDSISGDKSVVFVKAKDEDDESGEGDAGSDGSKNQKEVEDNESDENEEEEFKKDAEKDKKAVEKGELFLSGASFDKAVVDGVIIEEEFVKAKDIAKLTKKQIQVTRGGKTFTKTVYVDPSAHLTGEHPSPKHKEAADDYNKYRKEHRMSRDKALEKVKSKHGEDMHKYVAGEGGKETDDGAKPEVEKKTDVKESKEGTGEATGKMYEESELNWMQAGEIKNGDTHQYDDGTGWKIAKVVSTKPIINGFEETVGAYITWDDGTTGRYTGHLQIQPKPEVSKEQSKTEKPKAPEPKRVVHGVERIKGEADELDKAFELLSLSKESDEPKSE